MKCLLQRVTKAAVDVDGDRIGAIDSGLLVLVGFEKDDDPTVLSAWLSAFLATVCLATVRGV